MKQVSMQRPGGERCWGQRGSRGAGSLSSPASWGFCSPSCPALLGGGGLGGCSGSPPPPHPLRHREPGGSRVQGSPRRDALVL